MTPFTRAFDFLRRKSWDVLFYNQPDDGDSTRHWTKHDFLKANDISLYTNRAIDKRAEKVGEIDFYLVNRKTEDVVDDHAILALLQRPNERQTGRQFWALYQKYKDLLGEAYIWKEPGSELFSADRAPKALHLLRPDLIKKEYASDGTITSFVYTPMRGGVITFPAEEIIYAQNADPQNPNEGLPLIKAGIRAIDTENQLSRYHANVIRNGGNVGNILKFKQPSLTKQQVKELRDQYEQQIAEAKNAGKPLFLGGDADIIRTGLTPVELSYLESKRLILDDICLMTGVPKAILGLTSSETFSNAELSHAIFLRETIKPLLTDLASILDWRLVPEEFDLEFVDPTPENVEQKLKRIETGISQSYMTINEAREMEGLEPIPNGDQILVPFSKVPLEAVGEQEDPEPTEPEEKRGPIVHPLRDKFVRERYGTVMAKRLDRNEARVRRAVRDYFLDQRKRLVGFVEGKHAFRKKDPIDEWWNLDLEITVARGMLLPLIRSILVRSGQDAVDFGEGSRPFYLSSSIDTWLDKRAHLFATEINQTTYDRLKEEFAESLERGESRRELAKRIRETYVGFEGNRADTIARTEVHAAMQEGTIEGYKQSGLETKIWVAVGDAATRDSHLGIDGEEVPIDHPFGNGLMFPGDPSGPPEETVNCRCSI